ncbi:MAG: ferrochelatase [Xanthobacteraceae bacterium]
MAQAETAHANPSARAAGAGKIGLLLVNLGTPDAPDSGAVRRYLREFLSDPRVIENQGLVWKTVLNGVILQIRPRLKARDYQKIWNREKDESPLKTITRGQAESLAAMLVPQCTGLMVDWAMRYGNPSIAEKLSRLLQVGCDRILVFPLYPQYCAATTATVGDEVFRVLMKLRFQPALRIAPAYYDDPAYIEALAASTHAALAALDFEPEIIVASFHGVPKEFVAKGDPYYAQCLETTRLLRAKLGLGEDRLRLTFQSRFGRAQWLEPATDKTVRELARNGIKRMAVITPGFSADCLETLEEITVENAEIFKASGGERFAALPCLNDSAPAMALLRTLALRELEGWA